MTTVPDDPVSTPPDDEPSLDPGAPTPVEPGSEPRPDPGTEPFTHAVTKTPWWATVPEAAPAEIGPDVRG
jgi:hypothetical protein